MPVLFKLDAMSGLPETHRGWLIFSLVFLAALGAFNIFLPLFIVPKFEQIFQDALPGKPLPEVTDFIIAARIPLALVALIWPVAGFVAVWRRKRAALWIINLGVVFFLALTAITVFALFIPISGGLITGMPDAPLNNAAASR